MKQSLIITFFAVVAATAVALLLIPHPQNYTDSSRISSSLSKEQEKLVFLLQYIAKDYGEAVANGEIVDMYEFEEIREFSEQAAGKYASLCGESASPEAAKALSRLNLLIESKSDARNVKEIATRLIRDLTHEFAISTEPVQPPDLERGASLYAMGCAACHGINGAGDGPVAAELNPRPADFLSDCCQEKEDVFLYFNAIKFGIEGTAMPSFDEAFSADDSWSVAYYLLKLQEESAADPAFSAKH